MAFPIASRRSVSFPRGTRVTYVTWDVFREFGKVPDRSEVFTTSKRSASKQLSTLLKKDVGSVSR